MKKTILNNKVLTALFLLVTCNMLLTSCNDWLDVRSETEAKEEELFSKKGGYKDALTGIYLTLADRSAYGENLTMGAIEELANLWYTPSENIYEPDMGLYYLYQHDYAKEEAKEVIKAFYGKLFNAAMQANILLKNISELGDAIDDRQLRNVVEGEAHAIRAYVHFDILRLFGQLPKGGSVTVRLPYCETTTIDEIPAYYDFNAYVQKLQNDLSAAQELLGQSDPALNYRLSYNVNNEEDMDSYLMYRRFRLNYWAVKALQARLALYLGQTQQAHTLAMEVINAKGREDGEAIASLSGLTDLPGKMPALPNECLFALSKYDLLSYAVSRLVGGSENTAVNVGFIGTRPLTLCVSESMFADLFTGVNTASDNRYLYSWNRTARTNQSVVYPCVKKYWYDTTDSDIKSPTFNNLIIPMIRMSEMYMIALETTTSLDEANSLWNTYQRSHNVLLTEDTFNSLSEVQPVVQAEFLREFYAEGQMFYYYKRMNSQQMKWRVNAVDESEYILPLPETEYEPSK